MDTTAVLPTATDGNVGLLLPEILCFWAIERRYLERPDISRLARRNRGAIGQAVEGPLG